MKLTVVLTALAAVGAVAQKSSRSRHHTKTNVPAGYSNSSKTPKHTRTRTPTKTPKHTKIRTPKHTKTSTPTKGHKKGDHSKSHTGSHTKGDNSKSHHGGEAYAESTSYTTVTYDNCPSSSIETLITITEGKTVTYCPECEAMSGYVTTYTTVYESLCPTGMVPQTYTVTESCSESTPTWTPGPSHIPQGFTVTTKMCDTGCGETPVPVTVTEPCGCEANEGTPTMPPPAPATTTAAPPYPTSATCPGVGCVTQPTGGMTPPAGNTTGIVPVPATGSGVSSFSSMAGLYSFLGAAVVAGLAFAL